GEPHDVQPRPQPGAGRRALDSHGGGEAGVGEDRRAEVGVAALAGRIDGRHRPGTVEGCRSAAEPIVYSPRATPAGFPAGRGGPETWFGEALRGRRWSGSWSPGARMTAGSARRRRGWPSPAWRRPPRPSPGCPSTSMRWSPTSRTAG